LHEKTSILKTIRKIQKYEQRKKIDRRDGKKNERRRKEEGKKTEPNKNRYKKLMR
jgi:hypothetical protein